MTLAYRYTWEGSRMIVYEYEGGRRGHRYIGHMASYGLGVTLFPVKGGYDPDCRVPYEKKYTNILKMGRMPDYAAPAPIEPIAPKAARTSPDEREAPQAEYIDNSRYTGVQIKLI